MKDWENRLGVIVVCGLVVFTFAILMGGAFYMDAKHEADEAVENRRKGAALLRCCELGAQACVSCAELAGLEVAK